LVSVAAPSTSSTTSPFTSPLRLPDGPNSSKTSDSGPLRNAAAQTHRVQVLFQCLSFAKQQLLETGALVWSTASTALTTQGHGLLSKR
jgi:hypothetical protein